MINRGDIFGTFVAGGGGIVISCVLGGTTVAGGDKHNAIGNGFTENGVDHRCRRWWCKIIVNFFYLSIYRFFLVEKGCELP